MPTGIIEDQEEMVGAGHPSKDDTLNRGFLIEHQSTGAHKPSFGELYESTPGGTLIVLPTAGIFVKWVTSVVGEEAGAGFVVGDAGNDKLVIGAQGGGIYRVFEHVVYVAPVGNKVTVATHLNNNPIARLTETATLGGASLSLPDSIDVKLGVVISSVLVDALAQDGDYIHVDEVNNDTGFLIEFAFSGTGVPKQINFAGKYAGSGAHNVEVQIFDFSATVNDVQNGGTAYRCIRSHTSGAINEPGVGAEWACYWESIGAAVSEPAWATATPYTDGFVDVRVAAQDLPNASADYERHWLIPGTTTVRKDYVDGTGNARVRIIHESLGNAAHDIMIDMISLEDDQGSKSVTAESFVELASTDELDLRFASDANNNEIEITSVNFHVNRIKTI